MKTALKDLQDQAETLKAIGEKTALPGYVTAGIVFVRNWSISLAAVEVAGLLQDHIYDGRQSVVFTSATLRNGEGFGDFRRIAGIPERAADPGTGSAAAAPDPAAPSAASGRDFRFAAFPSPFAPEAVQIVVPPEAVSGAFEQKAL